MSRSLPSLGSLALLALLVLTLVRGGDERPSPPPAKAAGATVVRAVDGDTIEVRLDGGRESETVRYIGVDTPESVAPGRPVECYGRRASRFNARLVEGERVRLAFGPERRDAYGRLLAYVRVRSGRFVNAALLRRGYATTLTIAPNDAFSARFERLERRAAAAGTGLWGAC